MTDTPKYKFPIAGYEKYYVTEALDVFISANSKGMFDRKVRWTQRERGQPYVALKNQISGKQHQIRAEHLKDIISDKTNLITT